jgi:hypothetical protein
MSKAKKVARDNAQEKPKPAVLPKRPLVIQTPAELRAAETTGTTTTWLQSVAAAGVKINSDSPAYRKTLKTTGSTTRKPIDWHGYRG